jgi:hypothetical protein
MSAGKRAAERFAGMLTLGSLPEKFEVMFARGGVSQPLGAGTVLPRTPTLLVVVRDALTTQDGAPKRDRIQPLWRMLVRVLHDLAAAGELPQVAGIARARVETD